MSNELRIGKLLDATAQRDAIHVAIAPVVAGMDLRPGQHIGISDDGSFCHSKEPIGIVDPFLCNVVKKGERFYVFLYPNTVTSLRHEWTHPAFSDAATPPFKSAREASDAFAESERWLRAYAARTSPYTADEEGETAAYEKLLRELEAGDIYYHGSDLHGRSELEDEADLKFHGERVLGIKIDFGTFSFSCSC